jgi:preprotein translocase subunit SecA
MSSAATAHEVHTGAYAERRDRRGGALDRWAARAAGPLVRLRRARPVRPRALLRAVNAAETAVRRLGDGDLERTASALREPLQRWGFDDELVARTFALVREAARRGVGERHYDVQVVGGRVLLAGFVAEMQTGEGKTLTATLPAATAALAGIPVHVVTVNDYLAARDAESMAPIYRALGLTVGVVVHGMDAEARRLAYGCDVTYCTNKELAFDYLRDRLTMGGRTSRLQRQLDRLSGSGGQELLLRGLHFGIVDEADCVLIDEARTPLVISGRPHNSAERRLHEEALDVAGRLRPRAHFTLDPQERRVELTARGRREVAELAQPLGALWKGRLRGEELVQQALSARYLYHRDTHYLLQHDGRVVIVDEFTGRSMPDRSWPQGLHQLIEAKEGAVPSARTETLASISYQRFFRRYLRLAGMTATAREVAPELWSVYGLGVWRIAPNRDLRRHRLPATVSATADARWARVVERAADLQRAGRPVLIGTRSVAGSERLSALLDAAGLPHRVLNARQDEAEAHTVAQAGEARRITVATNMAGRGTDIRLGAGVAEAGGLHVIATEHHEAGRIDRQLFGRCGRQGDPGTFEAITSLEDELFLRYGGWWARIARRTAAGGRTLPRWLSRSILQRAQRRAERLHARMRAELLHNDEHLDTTLAFSGQPE